MRRRDQRGFSLLEMLISLTVMVLATSSLAAMLVQNGRMNKSKRMAADAQANARNCLEMVTARLRSAGWDPGNNGINVVNLDPDLTDSISQLEVFADFNGDGDTDDPDEQTLIRHSSGQVEWKPVSSVSAAFVILAPNVTNDADGDGNIEPMFQPDSLTSPTRIRVQITVESPVSDPVTGQFLRYTLANDVLLRKQL